MSITHRFCAPAPPGRRQRALPAVIRHSLLASVGALLAQGALLEAAVAAPQGGNVVGGQGQISAPDATTTLVHQQSHSMIVNWQSFDVAKPETVQFNQPSSSAAVLNRVLNQSASQIHGAVRANGQVFIVNGSGVVFGKDARVDVGGLFVSSLDITNSDFTEGRYNFKAADGQTPGAVVNRGLIQAARGGSVTLVGGQVANEGVIVADAGHVNLAAGRTATVDFDGDGLVRFQVDGEVLENVNGADAAVSNAGEIRAEGGRVLLSARAASQVFDRAVNNSGLIRAGGIQKVGGKVTLTGIGGGVRNTGTIDASGTSGGEVRVTADAVVEQYGQVRADGSSGDGGRVTLEAGGDAMLAGASQTSASSASGRGGDMRVLGDRVALLDTASVDVSGAAGGGQVLIGGDYQGANPDVRNARRTLVSAGASVRADSTEGGDGGRVIVWADEVTGFAGTISARGGAQGGDGGFVEVSGKQSLAYIGHVDTSAPNGNKGVLFLDPDVVNIDNTGTDDAELNDQVILAGDPGVEFSISAGKIVTELETSNVSIAATSEINVMVEVDASGNTASNGLTLDSATINFSDLANITLKDADLVLGDALAGNVVLADGATVILSSGAGAGNITVKGTVNGTVVNGNESLTLDAGTGSVTLQGAVGNTTPLGTLTVSGATASLQAVTTSGAQDYGGVATTTLNGDLATADASITLDAVILGAATVTIDTNATTPAGDITLGAVTAGGNTLTLETGAGVAGADVSGTTFTGGGGSALNLANIGGTATFTGNVTAGTLNVAGSVVNAAFTGTGNTITNPVTFANTGTLILGQNGGTHTYDGGITSTSPTATTLRGAITTSGDAITLGTAILAANVTLSTGTTGGSIDLDGDVRGDVADTHILTLTSGGAVDLDGITVGPAGSELRAFEVTGADTVVLGTVTVNGALLSAPGVGIKVQADTSITANGVLTTGGAATGELLIVGGGVTLNAMPVVGATDIVLQAGGDDVTINAPRSEANTITILANRDIFVQALLEATGATSDVILTADFDQDGSGGVRVDAGGQVRAGRNVIITGSDLFATGGVLDSVVIVADGASNQIEAGLSATGSISLLSGAAAPGGADILVNGLITTAGSVAGAISIDAANRTELGTTLTTDNGAVTFLDNVRLTGASTVSTGNGAVNFNGTVDGGEMLTVDTTGVATFSGAIGSGVALASLTTDAGGTTNLNGGAVTTTGAQTYNDAVTFNQSTTLQGSALTLSATGSMASGGNDLALLFDDMALGAAVNAGAGILTIDTLTARPVNLGSDVGIALGLTDAELDRITAGTLRIGSLGGASNNDIVIASALDSPGWDTLALRTTGAVGGAGSVAVTRLGISASGAVTLTNAANSVSSLAINTSNSAINFNNAGGFQVATVDGIVGLSAGTAAITLEASGGITQTSAITGAMLTATSTVGGITLTNGGNDVDTVELDASGAISFTDADDLTVGAGEVSGSQVTLNAGGALTLSGDVEGAGGGVTLISGGNLLANAEIDGGASAVTLNSGGIISQTGTINGGALSTTSTGGTTLGSANTVSAFAATNAGGGNVTLNNTGALALGAINTGGGDLVVTNAGTVSVAGASTTAGGALTVTTSAGAINGTGGSLNAGAGALTLNSATGIGTGGSVVSAGTGSVNLTTAGAGTAGNITLTDTSAGAFATSRLSTLATTASSQTINLTGADGFNFDSNAPVSGLSTDTLIFNGATTLNANLAIPAGSSVVINGTTTVGAGGANPGGAGSASFNGAVDSAQTFTVATGVANFTGDITMAGGTVLNLNSADTNFTGNSKVITDTLNLGGGAGSVDGPGTMTILRASASAADTEIGGADPLFGATNLAALGGFNGTLNLGGSRTAPPSAAQLLNNINVTGNLITAGDIFIAGAGDITFDNTVAGRGRFETTSGTGTITVAALGAAGTQESGNIRDTADFLSIGNPARVAIVANTVELLAANQIGQADGTEGARVNIRASNVSFAQGVEGDAQVDNGILSPSSSDSVLAVLETFRNAADLAGLIAIGDVTVTTAALQLLATPKQTKGELGFIDEGVFLLPSAFSSPERALLMPLLGDADFPGDQRPQDPNDDAAWVSFYEDVVRPYIAARHPLAENASAEERAAVEAVITSQLDVVIGFYELVRERERTQLALEEAARETAPPVPGEESGQEQAPPLQQGAAPASFELGYAGQPWSRGGIGVEAGGRAPRGSGWPVSIVRTPG